jgi:CBS domain-containing protein
MALNEGNDRSVHLLQHKLVVMAPDGVRVASTTVHCPLKRSSHPLERCLACPRRLAEHSATLECLAPAHATSGNNLCGNLLSSETLVLDAELPAAEGLALLQKAQLPSAPVVDDNRLLLGLSFASSLAALTCTADSEVDDAIADTVAANEGLTVTEVVHVMATRELDRLPIVDNAGHLLGVLTALDVLRWMSRPKTD